ncbi:SMP-30/gluconolactonase/LRE family protein [Roseomonas mucosa]
MAGGLLAGAAAWPHAVRAEVSVVSDPPRRWGRDAGPLVIPDPDVLVLDEAFRSLVVGNALIERVWTGGAWLEGPAWSSIGRYLVMSDTRTDRQYRYLWETGGVTVMREPSGHSNGNAFDFEGRQVICQHLARRVVRVEHDGSVRVIADHFEGRPLNSPNDVVPHPDGSLWFTDPPYGTTLAEGRPDAAGGPTNPQGLLNPGLGLGLLAVPGGDRRQPAGVYRWDPSGRLDQVLSEVDLPMPNGIAFSPDHRTLYLSSTEQGPGTPPPPGGDKAVHAFEVSGTRLSSGRVLSDMRVDGAPCPPDGIKVDVMGNLWCASSGKEGHAGVVVLAPSGKPLGRIRLPEVCANMAFGGPRRNMLFMAATRSLYRLQVNVQGAAPS